MTLQIYRDQLALHVPPEGNPIRPTGMCQFVQWAGSEIPGVGWAVRKVNYGANSFFRKMGDVDRRATGWVDEDSVPEFLHPYAKWLARLPVLGGAMALAGWGLSVASRSMPAHFKAPLGFRAALGQVWTGTGGIWVAAFLVTTNIIANAHQMVNLIDPQCEWLNGRAREAVNTACNLLVVGFSLWLIARPGAYSAVTRLSGELGERAIARFRARPVLGRFIREQKVRGEMTYYLDTRVTAILLAGWFAYIGYWNMVRTQEQNLVRLEGKEPWAGVVRPGDWKWEYHNLQPAVSEIAAWAGFAYLWGGYLFQWGTVLTSFFTRRIPGLRCGAEILKTPHLGKRLAFSFLDLPISMVLAIGGLQAQQIARNYGSDEAVSLTSNRALFTMTILTLVKNLFLARVGFVPSIILYSAAMWLNSPWASCTEANQTFFQNADYTAGLYWGAHAAKDWRQTSYYAVQLFNQHRVAVNDLPPGVVGQAAEFNELFYLDYVAIKYRRETDEVDLRRRFSEATRRWDLEDELRGFDIVRFFRERNFEKWDVRHLMEKVGLKPEAIEAQAIEG